MAVPEEKASPEHTAVLKQMLPQLLIVLMQRLNRHGSVIVPVSEIDGTGDSVLEMQLIDYPKDKTGKAFRFRVRSKRGGDGAAL